MTFSLSYGKSNSHPPPSLFLIWFLTRLSSPLSRVYEKRRPIPFTDLLAFLIVVWVGRKGRGSARYRIPTILDKIVRDATVYFLVLFTSHLVVEFFIIFAPVSHRTARVGSSVLSRALWVDENLLISFLGNL